MNKAEHKRNRRKISALIDDLNSLQNEYVDITENAITGLKPLTDYLRKNGLAVEVFE